MKGSLQAGGSVLVLLIGLLLATACVPYRVDFMDYRRSDILDSGADGMRISLMGRSGTRRHEGLVGPYALVLTIRAGAIDASKSRIDSVKLVGVSDSVTYAIRVGSLEPVHERPGAWGAASEQLALPYQDYQFSATVTLADGDSTISYPVHGSLVRDRRTKWGFWPWDVFMSA